MITNISIVRTDYAYALLYNKNEAQAQAVREGFDKRAKTHPYLSEVEGELEMLKKIDAAYKIICGRDLN